MSMQEPPPMPQHHIRLEIGAFGDATGNAFHRQVGLGAVIDFHLHAIGLDVGDNGLELARPRPCGHRCRPGALADLGRHHADGGTLAGAEDHRSGQAQGAENSSHDAFSFRDSAARCCKSAHSPSSR
jgi:hypothetical protein